MSRLECGIEKPVCKSKGSHMNEAQVKIMDEIATRCQSEEGFKERLLDDPKGVLGAAGFELHADQSVEVLCEGGEIQLSFPPRAVSISDEDLEKVAGGGWI